MSDENSTKPLSKSINGRTASLSKKEEMFVAEYLTDFNATQAAIRAGYARTSADRRAWKLMGRPRVAAAVRAGIKARAERLGLSADDVLLRALALYDMATAAVPVTKWDAATKSRVETGEYTFDGALAAKTLEMIGKMLGAFRDKAPGEGQSFVIVIHETEK